MSVKVSIVCAAYNQAEFIRAALDGFVTQKTNFKFQAFVYDDASTDGTAEIIKEYADKYPDIIKPILQKQNQFSRGVGVAKSFIWPLIKTEYVAVCDGDDYWTDPYKLQKQVDFMDKHPDYTICFHPVSVFWNNGEQPDSIWPRKRELKDISLGKLSKQNFIPNLSVMYRWQPDGLDVIKEWPEHIYPGDWFLLLLHAKHGKIGYLSDVMARYRRHSGGISFISEYGDDALHLKYGVSELNFFAAVEKQIVSDQKEYHKFVCSKARDILDTYARNKKYDSVIQVIKCCPDLMYENAPRYDVVRWHHNFNRLLILTPIILVIGIIIGFML